MQKQLTVFSFIDGLNVGNIQIRTEVFPQIFTILDILFCAEESVSLRLSGPFIFAILLSYACYMPPYLLNLDSITQITLSEH